MRKFLKKYSFIKYAAIIAVLDLLTRNEFEIGGGMVCLIGAIVAAIFMEKMEKIEKEDRKKDHRNAMA